MNQYCHTFLTDSQLKRKGEIKLNIISCYWFFFLHPFYFNILCDSDHCRFLVHYRPRYSLFDGCVELLYIEYIINQLIMGTWVRVMGMLFFDWSVVIDVQTLAFIWFTSSQRDIRIQALDRNYASTMYF